MTAKQQTAWAPSYFPNADRLQAFASVAATAGRAPTPRLTFTIGVFLALALASALQAGLYPELLGDIFARL